MTHDSDPPFDHTLGGQYALREEIGRGGAAIVYAADDEKHARRVAVKVLRQAVAEWVGVERFLREIEIAGRLQHPNIVPLYDSGSANGHLYFVMPYVEGETLRKRLDRTGPLPIEEAISVARDIARALQHAHEHGVVHRDIKPSNILLTGDAAVVADFGIARLLQDGGDATLTATGVIGTPAYMSPEQCDDDGDVGAASDVYALGCVVFEMIAGEPPYTGRTPHAVLVRHRTDPVPSLRARRPDVPAGIDAVLRRALAKAPEERPPSAAAFMRALEEASDEDRVARLGTSSGPIDVPRPVTPRWLRVVALCVAIAVPVAAIVAIRQRARTPRVRPAPVAAIIDANRIAIAPFEIFDKQDSLWREGLVDLLAPELDGAGPLRVVPPTQSIREWRALKGRSDTASALALSSRTGAGLVLYGYKLPRGRDSMQVVIKVYDAAHDVSLASVDRRDENEQPGRLLDSITVDLLREIGRTRTITAVRSGGSVGSRSMPALKAFLRGEQLYRSNEYEAAHAEYASAVAADSNFALAYRRLRDVQRVDEFDDTARLYALRAGALNRGLAPRESLLIVADSLAAATPLGSATYDMRAQRMLRRRQAALEQAARTFPRDPEASLELGELLAHFGPRLGIAQDSALRTLERAIAADSNFAPAYYHAIELSAPIDNGAHARELLASYLRLNPGDGRFALAQHVLERPQLLVRDADALLDTIPLEQVVQTAVLLRHWNDPAEASVLLLRHVRRRADLPASQIERIQRLLVFALVQRGHLREALSLMTPSMVADYPIEFASLATLGVVPADSAARTFARWLGGSNFTRLALALDFWGARRDSLSLMRAVRLAEGARAAVREADRVPLIIRYVEHAAAAQLARARADTAAAARLFYALPDSSCSTQCAPDRRTGARLLTAVGRRADAARLLDRNPPLAFWGTAEPLWNFERALLARDEGNVDLARRGFEFVIAVWRGADPIVGHLADSSRIAQKKLDVLHRRTR